MKRIHAFLLVTFAIIFGLLDTTTVCAADIVRGPYLQNATPNDVTIKWRTDVNETSKVWYGTSLPTLNQTVTDSNLETDHTIRISGLPSASKYFYQVGAVNDVVLAGGDANHYFVTSPPAGSTDPIRIWVLGDSGTADDNSRAVRDAYLELAATDREADIWLMLGDNAYIGGSDTEYQNAVFNTYPEILRNKPLWSTRGNHEMSETVYYGIFDLPANGEGGGLASGTEHYYSFDYGNVHFICLNSEESALSSDPNSAMYQWLEQDLAGTLQDWIIAYWHHPPYSKGSHNSDFEAKLVYMRENALPILEAGGVDLVLTGHSHSYERSSFLNGHYDLSGTFDPNVHVVQTGDGKEDSDGAYQKCENAGAVYIVGGSSGTTGGGSLNHPAMQVSINSLGSLIIDVNDTRMDVFFLRENTSPIQIDDYLTIESGGPPGWCYGSADIDGDGEVDGKDYAALAVRWRDSGCGVCGGADLSGDEQVEFDDLWWFTENWPDTYRKQASDPLPIDDSNEINVYTVVSWSADSYASHDVYFGTSDPPALQGNQTGTSFDPCDLEYNTTYYWKINEVYSDGDIIEGQLWNFTTWAVSFDPNLNLVGWWEFEEGAGADANDSAGNNDGTLMGNPNWVPGKLK
jgi:hypothetical protein